MPTMGIERHIELLLLTNDCVAVPGLGGFVAHHVAARYDEGEHLFLPPLRTVGFNPKLTLNDSLLAQSYIEVFDISYPEAMQMIERDVNRLRQSLDNHGYCELNGVGTLQLNAEGNYEFLPCEAGLLTPSLYALSPFNIEPLAVETPQSAEPVAVSDTHVEPATVSTATMTPVEPGDVEEEETRRPSLTTGILVAAAAAIILVVLFLSPNPIEQDNRKELMSMFSIFSPSTVKEEPADCSPAEAATVDSPAATVEPTADVAEPEVKQSPATPYYTIVLACKISRKNAEAYAATLTADGCGEVTVLAPESNPKVIVGDYATQKEAYAALARLRPTNKAFAEAWVYKVRDGK